jgi:hypothetical protein
VGDLYLGPYRERARHPDGTRRILVGRAGEASSGAPL